MKPIKSTRHVKIDSDLTEAAMSKAKSMNIAKNRNELANFVLSRVSDGSFKLKLDPSNYKWKEDETAMTSTVSFLNEPYYDLVNTLSFKGYRTDSYFIFNILIYNFLNFY